MKKSFLPFIAIAIATVSVFSSCNKNDDGYGQKAKQDIQVNPTPTELSECTYHGKSFFICDELIEMGNFKIQVSDGDKTAEYDIAAQGEHCCKTFGEGYQAFTAHGYCLKIVLPTKNDLKCKVTYTPNDNVKKYNIDDEFDSVWATASGKGKTPSIDFNLNARMNPGIRGDGLVKWCEMVADEMSDK